MDKADEMEKWIKKAKTEIKWVAVDYGETVYGYRRKPYLQKGSSMWHAR